MAPRTEWTDERIDEKMAAVDTSFYRLHGELTEFRAEMRAFRVELREDIAAFRGETREDSRALRADVNRVQDRLIQIGFGMAAALFTSLIAMILAVS